MDRRRVALALVALLFVLVPSSAMADRHTGDVGGGGGRSGRSDLKGVFLTGDWVPRGWHFGAIEPVPGHPELSRHEFTASVAGELGYVSGDHDYGDRSGTLSQFDLQVGLRLTYNKPLDYHVQPYGVGLAGFTVEQDFRDKTSFSSAIGFGIDVPFAFDHRLVFRAQQTWNWLANGTSDNKYGQTWFALVWRFEE